MATPSGSFADGHRRLAKDFLASSRARDAAWTNGMALWHLRDEPDLAAQFLLTLDRMVGLAGRGLLEPQRSVVGRLRRLLG